MSNPEQQPTTEAQTNPSYIRRIRSFVLREGRLTKAQKLALEQHWPAMGLDYQPQFMDFSVLFQRQAPTVLEIGFGMGKSLVQMAEAAPDKNFIGIEVHRPGVGACLADAANAGISNLRVLQHDAVDVLNEMIPDQSLSTVQLFFPDPWPKKKHHKRRIVQPDFVQLLRQKLAIGGVFHMATDWQNYAEHMLEVMQAAEGFSNVSADQTYVERPSHRPETKFELRGKKLGHGVWDLMFKREQ